VCQWVCIFRTASNLQERLRTAEWEISCAKYFDYIVVNEFLDETVETLKNIILSSRCTSKNFLANVSKFVKDDKIKKLLEKECTEVSHEQKT
jgi:guanylate kinase